MLHQISGRFKTPSTIIFAMFLILTFFGQIVSILISLEIRTTSHMKLDKKPLLENLKKYGHEKSVTDNWDKIQHDLHCCGVENYKDWVELPV